MADNAPFVLAVAVVWGIVAAGLLEAPVRGWWRRRVPWWGRRTSGRQAR